VSDLREKLERWAKLEPERCKKMLDDETTHLLAFGDGLVRLRASRPEANLRIVEFAVRDAIAARGWAWEVEYNPLSDNSYDGFVDRDPQAVSLGSCYTAEDSSAAVALLRAYLQALQAN
jgi:hypothetical protein